MALYYMHWIRNYFVKSLENSHIEFEPYDGKHFDLMVNGIHHRNGRYDIVNEKGDPQCRGDFYLTGQKP